VHQPVVRRAQQHQVGKTRLAAGRPVGLSYNCCR
jgi:hypothetical protein